MRKRMLSLLLVLCMVLTLLPFTAMADSSDVLSYRIYNNGITITGCDSDVSGALVIPDTIEGYPVTIIGEYAFSDCKSLTSVTIPITVTDIGAGAFFFCSSLTSVEIPDGVTSIGSWAFSDCSSLTRVTIPGSVTVIGFQAFDNCISLTSVKIPNSVTSIEFGAFSGCSSLTSVSIPTGIACIRGTAFQNCTSLKNVSIPNNVTNIESRAFSGCSSLTSVTIGNNVSSIGDRAFENCTSLKNVTIPNSVTSIGVSAFHNTGYYLADSNWNNGLLYLNHALLEASSDVTEAKIQSGTAILADCAFSECSRLTSVTIPDSVTDAGSGTFHGCTGLTSVRLSSSMTELRSFYGDEDNFGFFEGCSSLTSVEIPDSVTDIDAGAFSDCSSLTSVTIGYNVINIGDSAFYGCSNLTDVYYTGTQNQWNAIKIENEYGGNDPLKSATKHFNYGSAAIKTQPKSATIMGGGTATFKVAATGDGLKYQWQFKKPDGSWTNCTSKTTGYNKATLKVEGVTGSTNRDGYQYRCIVTDNAGNKATSNAATLHVTAITTQPKSATIAGGSTATFKVTATGSNLKYQWQYLKPDGSWTNCTSKTTGYNKATLQVEGVTGSTNRDGYQYRCKVTDSAGNTVTSSAAILTVKVLKITTQPKAASVKTTAYATFTVKATGDGLKYQWQYLKPNGSWTNCSSTTQGYNTATLKVQGVTGSTNRNGYQYRCIITDSAGSKVTSNAVKLNVLSITTQPKAASISKTGTATFKVAATGSSLKYQWQFKTPSGDWKNCTSATTGYNTATLKVQGVTGSTNRNGYQYRCVITDAAGNKLTTSAVMLTVK